MAVTPDTEIRLVKCNLDLDDNNQINFANATEQYNYFNGLTHLTINSASYQRKDNYIRYPAHIDSIIQYNYCMYKNTHYNANKWFYAYITKMEYENDNCTRVYIKTDVWQTWQFDLTFKKSFVEREHVNTSADTIGAHTVPEGLETGEFIINANPTYIAHYSKSGTDNAGTDSYVCLAVTDFPTTSAFSNTVTKCVNGIFNGLIYLVATGTTSSDVATSVDNYLSWYASAGKLDYIQSVFTVPKNLLYHGNSTEISVITVGGHVYSYVKASESSYRFIDDVSISINSTINGYTPKNKKLFTREYNNILVSNQAGTDVVMAYEDFTSNTPKFTAVGTVCPGCSVKLVPLNYKLLADSTTSKRCYDFGIPGPKYPVCAWTGDTFTNWLTQNGINLAIGVVGGVGAMVAAPFTGGSSLVVAGAIAGGAMTVGSSIAQVYQHSVVPETTAGNVSVGDVTYSDGKSLFTVYQMCIRQEYAKIIDDYFTMYGYKVNSLKVPNLTGRSNWNYVKMINPNIEGYIPQEDLQEIKRLFSNGITIWHTTTHFLDYSQSNT